MDAQSGHGLLRRLQRRSESQHLQSVHRSARTRVQEKWKNAFYHAAVHVPAQLLRNFTISRTLIRVRMLQTSLLILCLAVCALSQTTATPTAAVVIPPE